MNNNKIILGLFLSVFFFSLLQLPILRSNASEEQNVDTFDTDIDQRWEETVSTSTATTTVSNGVLNIDDTGLATQGTAYERNLRGKDFDLEGRTKINNYTTSHDWDIGNTTNPLFHLDLETGAGAVATDLMGSHNGNIVNSTWSTNTFWSNMSSYSLEYNYSYGYIDMGDHDDFTFASSLHVDTPFTYSFWYFTAETPLNIHYLCSKDNFVFPDEYTIWMNTNNILYVLLRDENHGTESLSKYTTSALTVNEWHLITVTYDASETYQGIKIYVDGEYPAQTGSETAPYTGMKNDTHPLLFGDDHELWQYASICRLDEIICWGEELNAGSVASLYEYYLPKDIDVKVYHGLEDLDTALDLSKPGLGLSFDTVNENSTTIMVNYGFRSGSTYYSQNFFNLTYNNWYRWKIKIDIEKSEITWEMYYDNYTKIANSKRTQNEITANYANIFTSYELDVFIGEYFLDNATINWSLDYIVAPFTELEIWTSQTSPDPDYFDSVDPYGCTGQTNETAGLSNEIVIYQHLIPNFDSVSGLMYFKTTGESETDVNEMSAYVCISLYGVDKTTGSLQKIAWIMLGTLIRDNAGTLDTSWADPHLRISNWDNDAITGQQGCDDYIQIDSITYQPSVEAGFLFYRANETSWTCQMTANGKSLTYNYEQANIGSEVLLWYYYEIRDEDAGDDGVEISMGFKDVQFQYRDILGFLPKLPTVGDIAGGIAEFFIQPLSALFRFLATIITGVMTPIFDGIELLLDPLIDIFGILGDILSPITELLSEVTDFFTDIIDDAFAFLVTFVSEQISELISLLLWLGGSIAELLAAIFNFLWDLFIEDLFTGITTLVNAAIDAVINIIDYVFFVVDTLTSFTPFFLLLLTVYIFMLSAMDHYDDPAGWIADLLKRFFINMTEGLTFLGVGIPLPLGLIWVFFALSYGWAPW
jgi:hypothetical protein